MAKKKKKNDRMIEKTKLRKKRREIENVPPLGTQVIMGMFDLRDHQLQRTIKCGDTLQGGFKDDQVI